MIGTFIACQVILPVIIVTGYGVVKLSKKPDVQRVASQDHDVKKSEAVERLYSKKQG